MDLAGSPVRPLTALSHDALLDLRMGPIWTVLRSPAFLPDLLDPLRFPVPLQPVIPGRPRDPELPAQARYLFLAAVGTQHKSKSLFIHSAILPGHSSPSTAFPFWGSHV